MEQREAERAARHGFPRLFRFPTSANPSLISTGAAQRRGLVAAPVGPLYVSQGFFFFFGADATTSALYDTLSREASRFGRSSIGEQTSLRATPSHCSPSLSRVSPSFFCHCPTLSQPSPFPAIAETKKDILKKKKMKTGVKRLRRGRSRREARRRQVCASLPSPRLYEKPSALTSERQRKKKNLVFKDLLTYHPP